jgi:dTDP-4-dehydrorhamnose reductase
VARLLVTGGAGYLGSEVVRRAVAAGWDVRATWWTSRPADRGVDWVRADVRDAVVHAAYRQSGDDAWSTNVDGSRAVAEAAGGARLVQLSTDIVFDGRRGPYREDDPTAPINEYGRSKAEAERLVAAAHPEAVIVRTSLLYGGAEPGQQERLASEGKTFFVDEIRSPTVVGDLADALLELVSLDVSGPLHVAGADDVDRYRFALLLGADPDRIERGYTTPDRAANVALDSSKARALLTTRLRGVREVLGRSFP